MPYAISEWVPVTGVDNGETTGERCGVHTCDRRALEQTTAYAPSRRWDPYLIAERRECSGSPPMHWLGPEVSADSCVERIQHSPECNQKASFFYHAAGNDNKWVATRDTEGPRALNNANAHMLIRALTCPLDAVAPVCRRHRKWRHAPLTASRTISGSIACRRIRCFSKRGRNAQKGPQLHG